MQYVPVRLHAPPEDADHVGHILAREGVVHRDPHRLHLAVAEELSPELLLNGDKRLHIQQKSVTVTPSGMKKCHCK